MIGSLTVAIVFAILLYYSRTNAESRRFLSFSLAVYVAFCFLAAIGKYPASEARHIAWSVGVFAMAAGLAGGLVLKRGLDFNDRIAASILICAMIGNFSYAAPKLFSLDKNYTDNDGLADWLESAAPSRIVLYYGAPRLKMFMEQSGAEIDKHQFFGMVNLSSGRADPYYFSQSYLTQDYDVIAKDLLSQLSEPVASDRMERIFRILENFRGYADYALDFAPSQVPVVLIATHVNWDPDPGHEDPRYLDLIDALSDRGCEHSMEFSGKQAFAMRVVCP